jgi:hypothetical protein
VIAIDFEASALVNGYPISVGVAGADGRMFHAIIKPVPEWSSLKWFEDGVRIHGYTQAHLKTYGRPAAEIATEMNRLLGNETVYSDAPSFDARWCQALFKAAGLEPAFRFSPEDVDVGLSFLATDVGIGNTSIEAVNRLRRSMATHNALRDAASWIAAGEAIAAWTPESTEDEIARAFKNWIERVDRYLNRA